MHELLNVFTMDLVVFSGAALFHSAFLVLVGYLASFQIFTKYQTLEATATSNSTTVDTNDSFRLLVIGVMFGTMNYFAGDIFKGTMSSVMLSLGFNEHTDAVHPDLPQWDYTNCVNTLCSTSTLANAMEIIPFDYEALLLLQDKWFNFFAI